MDSHEFDALLTWPLSSGRPDSPPLNDSYYTLPLLPGRVNATENVGPRRGFTRSFADFFYVERTVIELHVRVLLFLVFWRGDEIVCLLASIHAVG